MTNQKKIIIKALFSKLNVRLGKNITCLFEIVQVCVSTDL